MRKLINWIATVLGGLVVLLLVAAIALNVVGRRQANKTYAGIQVAPVPVPSDEEAIARGRHLAEAVALCADCHGADLGGREILSNFMFGTFYATNLTSGQGGLGADYSDEDWVRAVRHGLGRDDKSLLVMPSQHFTYLNDEDLGAIIAYMQSVPPVDRPSEKSKVGLLAPTLLALGMLGEMPAAAIDHDVRPAAPEIGVTVEYGEYLTHIALCRDCHGKDLTGGPSMGPPPGPNLTRSGDLGGWTEQDFVNTIRQGITPSGEILDREEMPWDYYTRMTDDELRAIWLYLQTLG